MKSTYETHLKELEKTNLVTFAPRKRVADKVFWFGLILMVVLLAEILS